MDPAASAVAAAPRGRVRDYVSLTKPRIVLLLLVTTWAAMVVAAGGIPDLSLMLITLLGGALSAGSANSFNCYIERDRDRLMPRTRNRPLPAGRLRPSQALLFAFVLGVISFAILAAGVNLLSALLATAGLLGYVLVYTLWLKPVSVHNTVVGGLAGAVPPLVGWAAVAGRLDLSALLLFTVIFLWQPPHFWALATFRREDYARAGIPMLPVVHGPAAARRQSLFYVLLTVAASLALYGIGALGTTYLAGALVLGAGFVASALRYRLRDDQGAARGLFGYSVIYLMLLFALMVVDALV